MKFAFIGTGALGGYYAARLAAAGHEVHCLCRSDHAEVARHGLRVKSCEGDFTARVTAHRSADTMDEPDVAVVCVKTISNDAVPALLAPVLSSRTLVLTLQNGLGNEEMLSRHHPADRILGGVCFLCSNRTGPGQIHHIAHGRVQIAEFSGKALDRTRRIAECFSKAGVPCLACDSLGEIRWRKSVWNIPFNGLSVTANGANVEEILDDPDLMAAAMTLMCETIRTANAEGFAIPIEFAGQNIDYSRKMGPYRTSMQIDFEHGRPLESEAIVGEPLRRALKSGVEVPAMRTLYASLKRWAAGGGGRPAD